MEVVIQGLFISSTGTEVGKTVVTAALTLALRERGRSVCTVKPAETGCGPTAADAEWLARCCAQPQLAYAPGLCRLPDPLAPAAAAYLAQTPAPRASALAAASKALARPSDVLLVEGAGGILVPLNERETMADLALELALPLLIVASDELGTISHTLTAFESAQRRGLAVRAVVLNRTREQAPYAESSNLSMLRQRLPVPVVPFPTLPDLSTTTLASAAQHCALPALLETI